MRLLRSLLTAASVLASVSGLSAAEIILPQNRNAYFSTEPIELAVAGVPAGGTARVELSPENPGAEALQFTVTGGSGTVNAILPPLTLAPNVYGLKLDGKPAGKLTVSTGVHRSTMLLSQTSTRPPEGGANFILGNAASFGLLDNQGQPLVDVRGKRSGGLAFFEDAVARDLPVVVYHYWTGYVVHKPFGDEKNWADPTMHPPMRLLSFSTAQRLRKYGPVVHAIGPIDEPGLAWGQTPAGGMASGFPTWAAKPWYEARGWEFTHDIASRSDADWMKYMTIRCAIIKENYDQARKDIKTVWPEAVWAGDLYAPQAVMDGTDPLNQQVNDIPTSHVFFDFFGGPLSVPGQIYLEKAHDPLAHVAHAMNGQLVGTPGPQRPLYHLLMNNMLAAGIHSNWWLNTGSMTKEDLAAVNAPAERLGPMFREMAPRDHDVALLWSFTEICQREKDVCAKEAKKKTGEQIKLLLPLPDKSELKDAEINTNAYEVGGTYTGQVLHLHQALRRAGYPAHVIHERLLPKGVLKNYKTLVVVGQTFDFPPDVRAAIDEFQKAGGKVVIDKSTTVKFADPIVFDADFSAAAVRARSALAEQKTKAAKNKRDASVPSSSLSYTQPMRDAVPSLKAALGKTDARPVIVSDDADLAVERHSTGEGTLLMVMNGHEQYPDGVPEDKPYPTYNFGPAKTTYTLQGVSKGSVVYAIEGLDWLTVAPLEQVDKPLSTSFAAGEMKLYLVVPRKPEGFDLKAKAEGGALKIDALLKGVQTAWPFTLTVTAPGGRELYKVYRATDGKGVFSETLPIGVNAAAGDYAVKLTSPIGGLTAEAKAKHESQAAAPKSLTEAARVLDEKTIRQFLASKPSVVIAVGKDEQKPLADELARALSAKGLKVTVKPEAEVLSKVAYPRVWDPFARLYKPTGEEKKAPGEVKQQITLSTDAAGKVTSKDASGKDVENWRTPNSLVTVGGEGYLDWLGPHEFAYEPGCKLYVDDKGQVTVLKGEQSLVETTEAFRKKWGKPWQRLTQHVGGYQLPPELPEAFTTDDHLILLGDSTTGPAVAALQASEVLPQVVDAKYPGPGKALVSFAWSPFAVEKNVILVGASDIDGLRPGVRRLIDVADGK